MSMWSPFREGLLQGAQGRRSRPVATLDGRAVRALFTGPERTKCVREDWQRSDNTADGPPWTGACRRG
jgi:hypothetical protein